VYFPIVWSTEAHAKGDPNDPYKGRWRVNGSGMVSFFLTDLDRAPMKGALPMADRVMYGKEDIAFEDAVVESGLQVRLLPI
jgi:hypothetical protein